MTDGALLVVANAHAPPRKRLGKALVGDALAAVEQRSSALVTASWARRSATAVEQPSCRASLYAAVYVLRWSIVA